MTDADKLSAVKAILGFTNTSKDTLLTAYLNLAKQEIISWRYSYGSEQVTDVPAELEPTQIFAVVAGFSQRGAENQIQHAENGIERTFVHADMVSYIRTNVIPLCKVL